MCPAPKMGPNAYPREPLPGETIITISRPLKTDCQEQPLVFSTKGRVRVLKQVSSHSDEFVIVLNEPAGGIGPTLPPSPPARITTPLFFCTDGTAEPTRIATPPPTYAATPSHRRAVIETDPAGDPSAIVLADVPSSQTCHDGPTNRVNQPIEALGIDSFSRHGQRAAEIVTAQALVGDGTSDNYHGFVHGNTGHDPDHVDEWDLKRRRKCRRICVCRALWFGVLLLASSFPVWAIIRAVTKAPKNIGKVRG